MSAERPNYKTNVDLLFPYSEVDYVGECNLVKIPISLNNLIPHVDYWGEGKIVTKKGIRGFSNCYNVNHQYQLVSSGPDLDKKIPNRIPVLSDENCNTSSYIKDKSVLTVTVAEAARITSSCAKDIVRIVNNEQGIVVVYGVQSGSQNISEHTVELAKTLVDLGFISNVNLPRELQGLTYYNTHLVFMKPTVLKNELYKYVVAGKYDSAVDIAKRLGPLKPSGESIYNIVMRLIRVCPLNTMSFAYKLWEDARNIARNQLPQMFRYIFNRDSVTIINKLYNKGLKLWPKIIFSSSYNAWGGSVFAVDLGKPVYRWKIIAKWSNGSVIFRLYNVGFGMYLDMGERIICNNYAQDRAVGWESKTKSGLFHLKPLIVKGVLVFYIINDNRRQALLLSVNPDWWGDRELWGQNAGYEGNSRFMWIIKPWIRHDKFYKFN